VGFCDTLCSTDSQTKSPRMIREPSFLYNANWWYPTERNVTTLIGMSQSAVFRFLIEFNSTLPLQIFHIAIEEHLD
jgi:hypothetical protein